MRIIGGKFRGRKISAPDGDRVRPTTDRVREALFNVLMHGEFLDHLPNLPDGAKVLDLFSGAGTLGLEALSRGATKVVFVDEHAQSRGAVRTNVETLGATGHTKIIRRNALNLGPMETNIRGPFDLVFLDPPYDKGLVEPALLSARDGGWLAEQALCVVEQKKGEPLDVPEGFEEAGQRVYGDTQVTFLLHRA